MPKIFILKIGSFIQPEFGDTSQIGLITGEPVNFGKLMKSHGYDVYLASDKNHKCEKTNLNYFDLEKAWDLYAGYIEPDDIVMLWQGGYYDQEHTPLCVRHYQFINYIQENKKTEHQFFMLTDTRLPLMNFSNYLRNNKSDFRFLQMFNYTLDEIDIDSSQIIMLSQASKVAKMQSDFESGEYVLKGRYIGNAYTKYKEIRHIPMYFMPLVTHSDYDKDYKNPYFHKAKKHDLVFTVQSLEYFDDYRLSRFYEFLMNNSELLNEYNVAVYGKHNKKAFDRLLEYTEMIGASSIRLPNFYTPVKFGEMKNVLRNSVANLCVSEKPYCEYDLLPNRIFESFATGCIPLIDKDIYYSTDCRIIEDYCHDIMPQIEDGYDVYSRLDMIKHNSLRFQSAQLFKDEIVDDGKFKLIDCLRNYAFKI